MMCQRVAKVTIVLAIFKMSDLTDGSKLLITNHAKQ